MKSFRLFIGDFGTVSCLEVTTQSDYQRVVGIVIQLRDRMLREQVLREPILSVFQEVYNDDTHLPEKLKTRTPALYQLSNKDKIRNTKPSPPTDDDVINFLQDAFPDLYLVDFLPSLNTVVWSETLSGSSNAKSQCVSINLKLTDIWLTLVSPPFSRFQALSVTVIRNLLLYQILRLHVCSWQFSCMNLLIVRWCGMVKEYAIHQSWVN